MDIKLQGLTPIVFDRVYGNNYYVVQDATGHLYVGQVRNKDRDTVTFLVDCDGQRTTRRENRGSIIVYHPTGDEVYTILTQVLTAADKAIAAAIKPPVEQPQQVESLVPQVPGLSGNQYDAFTLLVKNRHRVVEQQEIWPFLITDKEFRPNCDMLYEAMRRLRTKVPPSLGVIVTHRFRGYQFLPAPVNGNGAH